MICEPRWVGEFPCRGQEAPQRALGRIVEELAAGVKSGCVGISWPAAPRQTAEANAYSGGRCFPIACRQRALAAAERQRIQAQVQLDVIQQPATQFVPGRPSSDGRDRRQA
jgi:hypothetical protein